MAISVRGALWNRAFDGFTKNDGTTCTRHEAFTFLCDCLAEGKEKIPATDCDNFDFKKGCLGHPVLPTPVETAITRFGGKYPEGEE